MLAETTVPVLSSFAPITSLISNDSSFELKSKSIESFANDSVMISKPPCFNSSSDSAFELSYATQTSSSPNCVCVPLMFPNKSAYT